MTRYAVTEYDQNLLGKTWKGSVDSVFSKACNVRRDDGELVVLMDSHQSMLPNGIAIESFHELASNHLIPGLDLAFDGSNLEVDDLAELALIGAEPWSGQMCELARLPGALHQRNWRCLVGLASDFRPVVMEQAGWHPWLLEGPLFRYQTCQSIWRLVEAPVRAIETAAILSRLPGLGPGLTPSGDDFVVGYLAALETLPHLHSPGVLIEVRRQLTPMLERRTTRVGAHYVGSALSGRFCQSVIDLAAAFSGQDLEALEDRAHKLLAMGHSSGLDTCYGFLAGSVLPGKENTRTFKLLFPESAGVQTRGIG